MNSDDLNDFFDNLFGGDGGGGFTPPPPPTPEQILEEALKATDVHVTAFNVGQEKPRNPNYFEMLPSWQEELEHYLPILEEFEEYEQCAVVWKAIREIKMERANLHVNQSLNDLDIQVEYEVTDNTDSDEPDF